MQIRHVILRCRTPFDEMQFRVRLDYYQRVLELPRSSRIQSKIRLQRDFHFHPARNVHERPARPHRSMQRREFVILRRHQRHEIFPHDFFMLAQCRLHVRVNHALLEQFRLHVVIDDLRIVLRSHARQRLLLRLRNPEPIECVFDVVRQLIPTADHRRVRLDVRHDLVHVQLGNVRSPCRKRERVVYFQRAQSKCQHPLRIILPRGYVANDLFSQARVRFVCRAIGVAYIIQRPLDVLDVCLLIHRLPPRNAHNRVA